jgi:hypothetical protein
VFVGVLIGCAVLPVLGVAFRGSPYQPGCGGGAAGRNDPEKEETGGITALTANIEIGIESGQKFNRIKHSEEQHRCDRSGQERNPENGRNSLLVTTPLPSTSIFFADHYSALDRL